MLRRVAFRVDASTAIGSGHVVRCLTLADALAARGVDATFICREHEGSLEALIESRGFGFEMLTRNGPQFVSQIDLAGPEPLHAAWLGVDFRVDAMQFLSALEGDRFDWVIVDHYALDARWETIVRPRTQRLMVLDDLADRIHACDLLLDQNLGRSGADYKGLIPDDCLTLTGPSYALLRPEFNQLRETSLKRREAGGVNRILVSMGGVDLPNATGMVLDTLATTPAMIGIDVLVVMGQSAPWLARVREQVHHLPFRAEVRVNINDMAWEMCRSDVSIGAAGGTAWERCCLGVPTILMVQADNQRSGAQALGHAGAALVIDGPESVRSNLPVYLAKLQMGQALLEMQGAAARITDGLGAQRVVEAMEVRDARYFNA